MRRRPALVLVALVLLASCANDGRGLGSANDNNKSIVKETTPATDEGTDLFSDETLPDEEYASDDFGSDIGGMSMSTPFGADEAIPAKYTCDGQNVSPLITWTGVPEGTVEIAIQVIDLDSEDYTHWVITGIDPAAGRIEEGKVPAGAVQSKNSSGTIGYTGPCPTKGSTHN